VETHQVLRASHPRLYPLLSLLYLPQTFLRNLLASRRLMKLLILLPILHRDCLVNLLVDPFILPGLPVSLLVYPSILPSLPVNLLVDHFILPRLPVSLLVDPSTHQCLLPIPSIRRPLPVMCQAHLPIRRRFLVIPSIRRRILPNPPIRPQLQPILLPNPSIRPRCQATDHLRDPLIASVQLLR